MNKNSAQSRIEISAFSLIELSIVILIIGIIVAGVTQGSRLVREFKVRTAQTLTQSSPVHGIKDLMLWFEPAMEASFLPSEAQNNAQISTWYDGNNQIAVKNNALQATSTNQPLYIEGVINGLPVVRFDGVDNFLTFDGSAMARSAYTVFIVEQRRVSGAGTVLPLIGGTTASQHNNFHMIYDNNTIFRTGHFSYDNDYTIAAYSIPTPRIHTSTFSTTSGQKYWLNGGNTADASATSNTTALSSNAGAALGRLYNGSSTLYFNGDIAEVIIFLRDLKTEERQAIETYLAKKYAITLS